MSDKQIKFSVSADTSQAKKDVNELLNTAKQPLLIPVKTDTTESLKNIKDVQNEFKLLQNQFQNIKVSGDLKGLTEVQTRLEFLANSIKTIPKLDIKTQIDSQNIDNGINKIRTEITGLVNTAKQPIQIPLKTDNTEALKNVKDIQNEFKLLQSQYQNLKINGDTSAFSNIKSQIQDLSNKLKDVPKLDIKGQIQSQNINNGIAKIKKDIADVQAGKIDIKATMSGSISEQISSVKNSLASIQKNQVIQIAMAGLDGFFGAVGAIKNALGSLYNMAAQPIGGFVSEGYNYVKDIESSATSLGLALSNQATAQNKANQAFAEGKGTLEDYATITGKTTESFYESAKATGGASGATKAYKIDLSELKGQLLDIKQTTQTYNAQLKDQENTKKDLEKTTKDLIKGYNREVDSIQDTIKSLNDQEKVALVRANSTDNEIKNLERLIATKQKDIDIDEQKLNKELSKQTKDFDKQNKTVLDQIDKKEIALDKQKLEIQKRKNLLDNNPTANANALDQLKNEEEIIRDQTDELRLQKSEISLKRKELVSNIETQQQAQRDLIENKKEELEKNKEVADAKKSQNEEIKSQFQEQIDQQKTLIDSLKDKIEKANIKLDLDTAPIQAKIETIKDQIQTLQDQSQEVQNQINDKQQAQSEASAASGGGGGGGGMVLKASAQAELDSLNAKKPTAKIITKEEVQDKLNQILESSTKYAAQTPFEKKDVLGFAAQATSLGFDPLAGAKNGDIYGAGYNNILNVGSDFVAKKLQINGGTSTETVKEFIQAISYLRSGNTKSFSQFGVTGSELLNTGKSFGLDLEKQKDLADLTTEQITKILAKVAEGKGIQGSAKAQTGTLAGLESNSKDAYSTLFESFFGIKKQATLDGNFVDIFEEGGLGSQAKKTLQDFIDLMNGEGGDELRKSLKELGAGLGDLLKQLITPENLKATFDGLKSVVDGMKTYLTPENIKSFATAIGDFVKGIPSVLKTAGEILERIAATLGIKTDKVKLQEANDYVGKVKKQTLFKDGFGNSQENPFSKEMTDLQRDQERISIYEEDQKKLEKGEFVLPRVSEEQYKQAQEEMKKHLEQINKDTDEKRKEDLANLKQNEEEKRNAILETQRIIREEIVKTAQESKINFDTMATDSQNGFITLTNGAKIQLSEIGATSKSTRDEIILKFNESKDSIVQSFIDSRILSEPQIKLLAEISGKTVDEIKLKNEEIKNNLEEKFKTGKELSAIELQELAKIHGITVEEIKKKQIEIQENSSLVAKGINAEFGNVNLKNAKDEFLSFGSLFTGLQQKADNLLGTLRELSKNKDGSQANNIIQAAGNVATNLAKDAGIIKKANGGLITGGSGVRDDVPILAMGGEFVLTKNAVNKYGLDLLNEINQGKFDLNTPKLENIKIPTAPSPRISNTNNNQKSQTQNITNNITVPNSGNFGHNLKTSLVLYSEQLSRSANSSFSNISV